MAKIENNIVMRGARGTFGNQIVFRQTKGGQMIISAPPVARRTFNAAQQAHHEAFRNAIAYARSARTADIYLTKAQGTTLSAFNVAVADWLGKPQVLEIDITGWTGQSGQIIRVKATDDTQVTKVIIVIKDGNGAILMQDFADPSDGPWWNFMTTIAVSNPSAVTISATAYDLPGNTHVLLVDNN